jgi:hypothetical protein
MKTGEHREKPASMGELKVGSIGDENFYFSQAKELQRDNGVTYNNL